MKVGPQTVNKTVCQTSAYWVQSAGSCVKGKGTVLAHITGEKEQKDFDIYTGVGCTGNTKDWRIQTGSSFRPVAGASQTYKRFNISWERVWGCKSLQL